MYVPPKIHTLLSSLFNDSRANVLPRCHIQQKVLGLVNNGCQVTLNGRPPGQARTPSLCYKEYWSALAPLSCTTHNVAECPKTA